MLFFYFKMMVQILLIRIQSIRIHITAKKYLDFQSGTIKFWEMALAISREGCWMSTTLTQYEMECNHCPAHWQTGPPWIYTWKRSGEMFLERFLMWPRIVSRKAGSLSDKPFTLIIRPNGHRTPISYDCLGGHSGHDYNMSCLLLSWLRSSLVMARVNFPS